MSVYGISAFVDGLFKGREYRQAQEDKKYDRARQERMDEIEFAKEKRAVEAHGLSMQYDRLLTDKAGLELGAMRRDEENQAAYAKIAADFDGGATAAPGAMAPSPAASVPVPPSGMGAVTVGTSDKQPAPIAQPAQTPGAAAAQGVASNLGLDLTMADAQRPRPVQIPQGLGAVPAAQPQAATQQGQTMAAAQALPDPRARYDELTARIAEFERIAMPKTWREPSPQSSKAVQAATAQLPALYAERDKLEETLKAKRMDENGPNYNHQWGQPGGAFSDIGEAVTRGGLALNSVNDAIMEAPAYAAGTVANAVNRITNPWTSYIAGVEAPLNEMGALGPDAAPAQAPASAAPAPAPAPAPTSGAPRAPDPAPAAQGLGATPALGPRKDALPAMKQEAQAVANTAGPAAAVAVAAAQNVTGQPLGAPGARNISPAQYERASKDALGQINQIMELQVAEMVKRGDIERALETQNFLETAKAKQATKKWAAMTVAATVGDIDVFADNFVDLYNDLDLIADGTTIVRDKSSFSRDSEGSVNGATLVFKDEASGNTWEMVIDSAEELQVLAIAATSPEKMAEYHAERVSAAQEGARGAAKERRKEVTDVANTIFKTKNEGALDVTQQITYDEAMRQAQEAIESYDNTQADPAAAPPPLMRRP